MTLKASPGDESESETRFIVAQRGAREHFLVPLSFEKLGELAWLVVDFNGAGPGLAAKIGRLLPGPAGRRARGASVVGIPAHRVSDLGMVGLALKGVNWLGNKLGHPHFAFYWSDRLFAQHIRRYKNRPHNAFFGYSYASLEMLRAENERGNLTILDQIDPGQREEDLVEREREKWHEFETPGRRAPAGYWGRNRQEWELADIIMVNSQWTANLIVADGADKSKIEIIPLAYDASSIVERPKKLRLPEEPLRVLWLGTVCLRKGIHYLLEAAKQLEGEHVEFSIVGPIQIKREILSKSPANIKWMGPAARSEAPAYFASADLFILPTISDGFAITQLEAMAHGIPVISTWNCGDVVVSGKNGYRVPACDSAALAEAIMKFVSNPNLSAEMRDSCISTAREHSMERYGENLHQIVVRHLANRKSSQI
jgi:glycosyltransferase involved in cell wall biosynthesis